MYDPQLENFEVGDCVAVMSHPNGTPVDILTNVTPLYDCLMAVRCAFVCRIVHSRVAWNACVATNSHTGVVVGFNGALCVISLISTNGQPAPGRHVSTANRLRLLPKPKVPNNLAVMYNPLWIFDAPTFDGKVAFTV